MEMNLEEYGVMHEIEEDYWWYRGLRHIVFSLLNRYYQDMTHLAVLDAGCGTRAIMQRLPQLGHCLGFDYSAGALKFCCKRGIDTARLALASVEALPYRSNTFDLVTSFDVLCCADAESSLCVSFSVS
jgi:ubiquinone/menaquinone biosynthesis C-methylase UbiE